MLYKIGDKIELKDNFFFTDHAFSKKVIDYVRIYKPRNATIINRDHTWVNIEEVKNASRKKWKIRCFLGVRVVVGTLFIISDNDNNMLIVFGYSINKKIKVKAKTFKIT